MDGRQAGSIPEARCALQSMHLDLTEFCFVSGMYTQSNQWKRDVREMETARTATWGDIPACVFIRKVLLVWFSKKLFSYKWKDLVSGLHF